MTDQKVKNRMHFCTWFFTFYFVAHCLNASVPFLIGIENKIDMLV